MAQSPAAQVMEKAKPPISEIPPHTLAKPTATQQQGVGDAPAVADQSNSNLMLYAGTVVDRIEFSGVEIEQGDALRDELALKIGKPLDVDALRDSVRRLYQTGLYRSLDVRGIPSGVGNQKSLTILFVGMPRYFVGRVTVTGLKSERLISLLQYSTQLQSGSPFTASEIEDGISGVKQTLAQNGYEAPIVTASTHADEANALMDVIFDVKIGPQARIGDVSIAGNDPGLTVDDFREKGKLKRNNKVTRDTTSNALNRLRKYYQKQDRLEAVVALESQKYSGEPRRQEDYGFRASQGPTVRVVVEGTKISASRLKKLLPIYEESAVDNDLLNEGAHNIREFLQRRGFFDARVDPKVEGIGTAAQTVIFKVTMGQMYRVSSVNITGNKYFDLNSILERMQVVKADAYVRNGRYSQTLLENDVDSISALYKANGFTHVGIATSVKQDGFKGKYALMRVDLKITEGDQQKFGTVVLQGEDPQREETVRSMLNTIPGQPFSLSTVSGDRDVVLQYYLARGFEQARVEVKQQVDPENASRTNITFMVTEGQEVFVNRVLVSGDNRTKKNLVNRQLLLKSGDPLDQSALVEMQRRFYNLAIFNEANVVVQNPDGATDRKNVLVQLTEAKRWDVTYGGGFEAQTGQPQTNCRAQESLGGSACTPEGKAGASFRVSTDVSRINLRGTDQSITVHGSYGLLERIATVSYNYPRLFNKENLTGILSGGYTNVQNISTFKAATLQGVFRLTQKIPRADTLIYDFTYRRVSVDQNSLQVTANLIPLLSQPVRVGGPGITWFHDTRSPSPLDAQRGVYLSVQDFLANDHFGSQTDFNRLDTTFSTYYTWGSRRKYTFARNTRIGFENTSGKNPNEGVAGCEGILLTTNASCNPVPLPERLYAGGATSHRGFAINSAGPRDLTTGYPVGGSAVFVNTFELRMPPPTLPVVGSSVSFVLFHDMGNSFLHINDIWPSFGRFRQPNRSTCYQVSGDGPGTCNFAYFSHAVGLGARYGTPIGPIRVDFSYNLNPPVYPIIDDYSLPQANHAVGNAGHFNFFFSIGQSF